MGVQAGNGFQLAELQGFPPPGLVAGPGEIFLPAAAVVETLLDGNAMHLSSCRGL